MTTKGKLAAIEKIKHKLSDREYKRLIQLNS